MDWKTRIDPQFVGLPDEETMACEDGLVENHHYRDLRWIGEGDFARLWEQEQALLDYKGDPESDEAWDDLCDNEVYTLGLDPGVASTVAALAALGAVPVTSCSGAPGHFETHPLVLCWVEEAHVPVILDVADEVGAQVEGVGTRVLIYTEGDVSLMRDFAQALIRRVRGLRS
jgi:hypothetical protein